MSTLTVIEFVGQLEFLLNRFPLIKREILLLRPSEINKVFSGIYTQWE